MKRIRPAPMGRAFRVVKRTAHLTVRVRERPLEFARRDAAPKGQAKAKPADSAADKKAPARARRVEAGGRRDQGSEKNRQK
jgi:large subunit ribosomal protein L22